MKKVLVAVVLMMGIGSFSAFAAEISVDSVVIACEVNQDDFVKVEVSSGSSYAIHREILSGFSDPRGICCGKD